MHIELHEKENGNRWHAIEQDLKKEYKKLPKKFHMFSTWNIVKFFYISCIVYISCNHSFSKCDGVHSDRLVLLSDVQPVESTKRRKKSLPVFKSEFLNRVTSFATCVLRTMMEKLKCELCTIIENYILLNKNLK